MEFTHNLKRRMLRLLRKAGKKIGYKSEIQKAIITLQYHLVNHHGYKVAYGPFQGMILSEKVSWGGSDINAKILGTYERQIINRILEKSHPNKIFIDIGAADGFFAVGASRTRLFKKTYAFEINQERQKSIKHHADINKVMDQIEIRTEATSSNLSEIIKPDTEGVVLIDIEGDEFQFLTDEILQILSSADVIIEMHDPFIQNGEKERELLISRAKSYFRVQTITAAAIYPSEYPELNSFPDTYRLLAFNEGRKAAMDWLCLEPLSKNS